MADKFEQFFTDTLNEILLEHVKELKSQSEIDEFYEKYEKADFSELLLEMINDTSNQLVANAKSVMYENTLLFRCEEAEIVARINYELNIIASFISKYGEEVAEAYISSHNTNDRYEWARACGEFDELKRLIIFNDIRNKADFPSDLWKHQYQLANEVVHPSSQGTFNRLGTMIGEDNITVGHTDYGLTTPGEHSAITLAQLTGLLLTVYPSGDALVATKMINKWVDVVREEYFKTHDYIFPDESKLRKKFF